MASKQAKAHEFSQKEREKIINRDKGQCIFCRAGYRMEGTEYGYMLKSIMHYIPRSKGGLGIEQNGAIGCQYHHELMDNGNKGCREEMLEMFKAYLSGYYSFWEEEDLIYNKWR